MLDGGNLAPLYVAYMLHSRVGILRDYAPQVEILPSAISLATSQGVLSLGRNSSSCSYHGVFWTFESRLLYRGF